MNKFRVCIVICGLFFVGCEQPSTKHLHNTVVWDKDGNAYMLDHNIGDTFFVHPLK